jgi:DNA-binding winged helix-turn-helix (wHTH) protein
VSFEAKEKSHDDEFAKDPDMSEFEKHPSSEAIVFGKFSLSPAARLLELDGEPVTIGSRALDILCLLLERAGMVVSKDDLIARAWPHVTVDGGGLKVQIASLRRILGDGQNGARYIATVTGRGYCFVAPAQRRAFALEGVPLTSQCEWCRLFRRERAVTRFQGVSQYMSRRIA